MTQGQNSVLAFCDRIGVPAPWSVAEGYDRDGAHHTIIDANRRRLNLRIYETELDARTLTVIQAFAPIALAYVERSAAKGGVEAQKIIHDLRRACLTPACRIAP